MARFTRIPETNLAGILGGIAGRSAGNVVSTTNLAIKKLQDKLDDACEKVSNGDQTGYRELESFENTITTLESTISTVERTVEGLSKSTTAIRIPISGIKVALRVAKYAPIPSPVASVAVLQSDIIETLSELIAQIEQVILTLDIITKVILDLLKKLKDPLNTIHNVVIGLKASLTIQTLSQDLELTDLDKEILSRIGVLGEEGNIFEKLVPILNGKSTDIIWIGNYASIDIYSAAVVNRIKSTKSETIVDVPVGVVGNWVVNIYQISKTRPELPVGPWLVPQGWTRVASKPEQLERLWKSKGIVSGMTGKVLSWTEPEKVLYEEVSNQVVNIVPAVQKVNVFRLSKKKIDTTRFNMQEANAVLLSGPEEAYQLMISLFQTIDNSPLSPKVKDIIQFEVNPVEDQTELDSTEEWYISKSGEKYRMKIKSSSVSPTVATLRHVEVTDETGTIVYEGEQTFAVDSKVLFEETKVRLLQLLR